MSDKKYANGGQVGKSQRMNRLRSRILNNEPLPEKDPLDDFDIADEPTQAREQELEDPKDKRMQRIGQILSEIAPFQPKKWTP